MVSRTVFLDIIIDKNIVLSMRFQYLEPVTGGTGPWIVSCTGMYSYLAQHCLEIILYMFRIFLF